MNRPEIRIHDLKTGKVIDRSMNDEEFDIWQKEQEQLAIENAKIVIEGKDGEPWGVDYNSVVSALTLAVQELTERLEKLEAK